MSASTGTADTLGVGIVGVGRHGSRYAKHAASDVDGMALRAVCRRNREAGEGLASELGCDYTDDALGLISRDDVDLVILVTLPDLLPGLVEAAATRGKRLLVEKPVAPDLKAGREMLRTIDDAGIYCMAGHTLRFNTVCNDLRAQVPSLGRLDSMIFSQRFPPQLQLDWLDQPAHSGGGNVMHTGVHCFDQIRFLTGLQPDKVASVQRRVHTRQTEDLFAATITFRDHAAVAQVQCSRSTQSRNGLIEITGENGQLVGDHVLNTLYRIDSEGRHDLSVGPAKWTVLEALKQLVEDARTGSSPLVSFRDGLKAIAVADACYRSNDSGSFESVEKID